MSNNNPSYKVSLFRNFRETYPVATIELGSWLCSDEFRLPIEAIRKSQNPEERRALKASLPCITPSGIFQQRNANQLIQHSGLLCIDIDGAENPHISDWEVLKQEVASFPGLYYAGLSASGRGIFLLIKIANPQRHDVYFRAIAEDLKKQGIIVDMHCRDLARLRGASYDPHPVLIPVPEAYCKMVYQRPNIRLHVPISCSGRSDTTAHRVERLLSLIERTNTNIADDYDTWLRIGCSLASEYGESGRRYFHTVSRQSAKYHPTQCDRQYDHCMLNCSKSSIGTFFFICKSFNLTLSI
ncbi:PriCT-2 domain-containing protein [Alistipes provencensis]|uniref:PriCT-2 domain-containing protein n=1 Tax=Alistipes provencensis TaxID=1816676 RepID=UPI0007EC4504|nr:PriCT-2 domain-containing protein [Alistipes provencensis]